MRKATLEMLIARKTQGELDKLRIKQVDVPRTDFALEVKKPPLDKVLGLLNGVENAENMIESIQFMKELIYTSCPLLHDKALIEAYECVEPYDIVLAVLNDDIGALSDLTDAILDFYGLGSEKKTDSPEDLEETVKN